MKKHRKNSSGASPPAGFIKGEHYHDPQDPGVFYPSRVVRKALRKRAKPARRNPRKARMFLSFLPLNNAWAFTFGDSITNMGDHGRFFKTRKAALKAALSQGLRVMEHGAVVSIPNVVPIKSARRRHNPANWYILIQRPTGGPRMIFNGRSFDSNPPHHAFKDQGTAVRKAKHLLGAFHRQLSQYRLWVADTLDPAPRQIQRVNPETRGEAQKLDEAARKLEDFTGHEATHVERAPARSKDKTGLVVGELDMIGYRVRREGVEGGRLTRYAHKFRRSSRPLLAVSTDGKQLHVVGGQYEFTEAGIEDR